MHKYVKSISILKLISEPWSLFLRGKPRNAIGVFHNA